MSKTISVSLVLPSPRVVVQHCEALGLDRKALASCLAVNVKTIERWQEGQSEPNETVLRLLEKLEGLYRLANRLLKKGSQPAWLHSPNEALGGTTPISLLVKGEIDPVRNALGMLEWGIYS